MNPIQRILLAVSSGLGIGWLPAGGSLISIPVAVVMVLWAPQLTPFISGEQRYVFLAVLLGSALIAGVVFTIIPEEYRKRIVVDHVWGMLLTLFLLPLTWKTVLMGFALFRFFDITKPWPSYALANIPNGFGTILDDLFCGLQAALSLHAIHFLYGLMMSYL